ncbi:PLP-dependent transferase [Acidisphaera sp. S103]|uniref:PLP-dependent transferase n=1 Tax=Acidisphaera sp. S103 TaxID=1747223 RepID=UPI00131D2D43|nr:PLP-dependent transferase [Acidisphaera sp. S103]
MAAHCANAENVAQYLSRHRKVSAVTYPTLFTCVDLARLRDNMSGTGGPLLQFELADGLAAGRRFVEALQLIYHVSNIGDARTLATHPASTTYASVSPEARRAAGVNDGTIRLSVGIEHIEYILADLEQAPTHA